MNKYHDREDAGKILAQQLLDYANKPNILILALPRGGVPVAYEIAKSLHAPLDVFIVRKLGVPGHEEFAMGAIARGITFLNHELLQQLNVSETDLKGVITAEQQELMRREASYRGTRSFPSLTNKTVILVDDGIATGATMRAALLALRQLNPERIIVAVPVADKEICQKIMAYADAVICPLYPKYLHAVGMWYEHFDQISDDEVRTLLQKAQEFSNNPAEGSA